MRANLRNSIKVEFTAETKCSYCPGAICCSYFTQGIETPRSKYDFEHLLWQISHHNVNVYKDDEGWYLMFRSSCQHLLADGRCGIYQNRPQICRDYSNEYCEMDEPAEKGFELFFDSYDALRSYCKKRFKTWQR